MTNTYYVLGTLEKEYFGIQIDNGAGQFKYFTVCQEIEAPSPRAAADHFEANGWEWEAPPSIRLISEATKLERAGQPSLFELR